MTDRRQELLALTDQFVDAFNRMDLDDVVSFFSEDAVYEDSAGGRHVGHKAIRTAFEPLVGGSRGKIRFDGEDIFVEVETGKVLASWRLNLDKDGNVSVIRGIDVLEFQGNKLAKKLAYMKVDKPHLETDQKTITELPLWTIHVTTQKLKILKEHFSRRQQSNTMIDK